MPFGALALGLTLVVSLVACSSEPETESAGTGVVVFHDAPDNSATNQDPATGTARGNAPAPNGGTPGTGNGQPSTADESVTERRRYPVPGIDETQWARWRRVLPRVRLTSGGADNPADIGWRFVDAIHTRNLASLESLLAPSSALALPPANDPEAAARFWTLVQSRMPATVGVAAFGALQDQDPPSLVVVLAPADSHPAALTVWLLLQWMTDRWGIVDARRDLRPDAMAEVQPVIASWPEPVRPENADWSSLPASARRGAADLAAEREIRDLLTRVVAAGDGRVPITRYRADQPVAAGQMEDLLPAWSDPPTPVDALTDRIHHAIADARRLVGVHLLHLHRADAGGTATAECLLALDGPVGPPRIYSITVQAVQRNGGSREREWLLADWRRSLTRSSVSELGLRAHTE